MKIGTYENATIFERAQTGWWASTKREGLFNQATIGFNLTEESLHMQNTFGSCTLAQCKNWLRPFKLIRFPFIDFAQCRLYRLLYFASLAKQSNLLRFVYSSHKLVQVEIQHHSKWFDFFDSTTYMLTFGVTPWKRASAHGWRTSTVCFDYIEKAKRVFWHRHRSCRRLRFTFVISASIKITHQKRCEYDFVWMNIWHAGFCYFFLLNI